MHLVRPIWRTVKGGSQNYVKRMLADLGPRLRASADIQSVRPAGNGKTVVNERGKPPEVFDAVIFSCHADASLKMLDPSYEDQRLALGSMRFSQNSAWLHHDASLMPQRRMAWASWNVTKGEDARVCVTYWMNKLQGLPEHTPLFVTLNPAREPDPAKVLRREICWHPVFDASAMRAQKQLWSLQGQGNTWWCGSYFGAGFHEDGLQSGLAVAEALGGVRRPWTVANESGRIQLPAPRLARSAVDH
jgi:predicted NAD/FAD-binding protein